MKKLWAIQCLCLFVASGSRAQDTVSYRFRHISIRAGLSSMYVRKIVQDPFGFLWIGTQDGLNRYDGKHVTIYNTQEAAGPHSISGMDIRDLALDTASRLLWEVNSYGGIDAISYTTGNSVYHYLQTRDKTTAGLLFRTMALLGHRLFLGSTRGLFVFDTRARTLTKIALPPACAEGSIDKLIADRAGRLWLFLTQHGVLVLEPNTLHILHIVADADLHPHVKTPVSFYDCTLRQDGAILSATSDGLKCFYLGTGPHITVDVNPFPAVPLSQNREVYACTQDQKGDTWFAVSNYCIRVAGPGQRVSFLRENSSHDEYTWLPAIYAIYFDHDDNLWLGCQQGLAFACNRPSPFLDVHRSATSQTIIQHAYLLNPVSDSLLYCCAQDGLYAVHLRTGVIDLLSAEKPFYHAFIDPFGRHIVSDVDRVFVLPSGPRPPRKNWTPLETCYPEFGKLGKLVFNCHCYIGDSLIVFGTMNDHGIVIWNYRAHQAHFIDRYSPGLYLNEDVVNAIYKDSKNLLWVLGESSITLLDLVHHRMERLDTYNREKQKFYSIFFDLCELGDRYYLASYGTGVLVFDARHHLVRELSVKDGLANNGVYKLLPYKDSLLFVTSNNGLSVIDPATYQIRNFYESDGLHSDYFEEYSGAVRNDLVYAGGTDGFTIIDPSLLPVHATPPRLFLRQIRMQTGSGIIDTSDLELTSLQVPKDILQTSIAFSCLNYANPERAVISYRIREINNNWTPVGPQDLVNLIGLGPGTYTLEVTAANEDNIAGGNPLLLRLVFLPKWYQTLWFKLLVLALVAGLLYVLYAWRIAQLKKQQQIRKDIASDLHDDIGGTLNSVKIFTHLARREGNDGPHLLRIEESITEATSGLRDLIWVLDDSQDTIRELIERVRKFTLPVCQAKGIHFECTAGEDIDDKTLPKPAKRNLLLIIKEAINNSVKHAECGKISVAIRLEAGKFLFSIQDDGKGFPVLEKTSGYGLRNIAQRAIQIHYSVQIHSSPDVGTTILLLEK